MNTLIFATGNAHKLAEIRRLLPGINILGLADLGITEDIPETADSPEGNARQKAEYLKKHYGYNAFSDDTVLEVEALDGAPGVHSARYAGIPPDPVANVDKLLQEMQGITQRKARFRTVIALLTDEKIHYFEGICKGTISHTRTGTGGFGYDPVFIPDGYDISFAQMTPDEKNNISHRGKAVRKLVEFLQNNF